MKYTEGRAIPLKWRSNFVPDTLVEENGGYRCSGVVPNQSGPKTVSGWYRDKSQGSLAGIPLTASFDLINYSDVPVSVGIGTCSGYLLANATGNTNSEITRIASQGTDSGAGTGISYQVYASITCGDYSGQNYDFWIGNPALRLGENMTDYKLPPEDTISISESGGGAVSSDSITITI